MPGIIDPNSEDELPQNAGLLGYLPWAMHGLNLAKGILPSVVPGTSAVPPIGGNAQPFSMGRGAMQGANLAKPIIPSAVSGTSASLVPGAQPALPSGWNVNFTKTGQNFYDATLHDASGKMQYRANVAKAPGFQGLNWIENIGGDAKGLGPLLYKAVANKAAQDGDVFIIGADASHAAAKAHKNMLGMGMLDPVPHDMQLPKGLQTARDSGYPLWIVKPDSSGGSTK